MLLNNMAALYPFLNIYEKALTQMDKELPSFFYIPIVSFAELYFLMFLNFLRCYTTSLCAASSKR